MNARGELRVERLGPQHRSLRRAFSCGVQPLDDYLKAGAGQDQRRGVSVAYVLMDEAHARIAGYYTLSAAAVGMEELPPEVVAGLPRYPAIPAFLIGRLAVDSGYRGQGIGGLLLVDALRRAIELSEAVAAQSVVVDAKDDGARRFYEKYGFQRLRDDPRRLYLPMESVRTVVRAAVDREG